MNSRLHPLLRRFSPLLPRSRRRSATDLPFPGPTGSQLGEQEQTSRTSTWASAAGRCPHPHPLDRPCQALTKERVAQQRHGCQSPLHYCASQNETAGTGVVHGCGVQNVRNVVEKEKTGELKVLTCSWVEASAVWEPGLTLWSRFF